jgi:DNA-binding NtrC family response regulator
MPHALIIDDDASTLSLLSNHVERRGFSTVAANSFANAKAELARVRFDVVLLDVLLGDGSGLDLLLEIPRRDRPDVILMSGEDSVQRAIAGMGLRNVHFLLKPIELAKLSALLDQVRKRCRAATKEALSESELSGLARLIGTSPQMQELAWLVEKVATTKLPVYIEGESGTGKELVARAIHELSPRMREPFIAINCGAMPETLIDSELFGHDKGAFTGATDSKSGVFEQASTGTLFLDEISEMGPELQVRLLRVLETGRVRRIGSSKPIDVDVRIIAATNRPASEAIAEGKLREDLYHRLAVFPIHTPPLRDRKEDIPLLIEHFLNGLSAEGGKQKDVAQETVASLQAYSWPGNVRQLRNAVQRAYVLADQTLTPECLPDPIRGASQTGGVARPATHFAPGTTIAAAERTLIESTLERLGGNKDATAEALGISRRTLYNRLKEYAGESAEETSRRAKSETEESDTDA